MESGFLEFVYNFHESMKAHEIKLAYEGPVTQQITKAFIAVAEAQMADQKLEVNLRRKVFHLMVECLQNISRYAHDYESGESRYSGRGIFVVSSTNRFWRITTGNAITNNKAKDLKDMIDQINGLDQYELKDLYVQKMQDSRSSAKGGAGLGFIDIRRKTGQKLEYLFLPISDDLSFFLLNTSVPQK